MNNGKSERNSAAASSSSASATDAWLLSKFAFALGGVKAI